MSKRPGSALRAQPYHDFYSVFESYDQRLISLIRPLTAHPARSIIDLACGVGFSTRSLRATFPGSQIIATDVDPDMVQLAQSRNEDCGASFSVMSAAETLADIEKHSVDVVFVKSAYHYFEDELPVGHIVPLLSDDGVFVIAERTERSARSYTLPEIARRYWADFFSDERRNRRFNDASAGGNSLRVSCFGEYVDIPRSQYFSAVRNRQLFGLAHLSESAVSEWIEATAESQEPSPVRVYEEFWLYVFGQGTR